MKNKKKLKTKKKRAGIIENMQKRYRFGAIFDYNSQSDIIIPKFNVISNNTPFLRGSAIYRFTSFGGINLFNYIGRDIAGTWDPQTRYLTILGFY